MPVQAKKTRCKNLVVDFVAYIQFFIDSWTPNLPKYCLRHGAFFARYRENHLNDLCRQILYRTEAIFYVQRPIPSLAGNIIVNGDARRTGFLLKSTKDLVNYLLL